MMAKPSVCTDDHIKTEYENVANWVRSGKYGGLCKILTLGVVSENIS
jgi:hypothetical protein